MLLPLCPLIRKDTQKFYNFHVLSLDDKGFSGVNRLLAREPLWSGDDEQCVVSMPGTLTRPP